MNGRGYLIKPGGRSWKISLTSALIVSTTPFQLGSVVMLARTRPKKETEPDQRAPGKLARDQEFGLSGVHVDTIAVGCRGANHHEANDTNAESVLATLFAGCSLIECPRRLELAHRHILQVYRDYSLHAPRPAALHILVRLRVLGALASNAASIGFPPESLCRDDFISPYNLIGPSQPGVLEPLSSRPQALQPTPLQRTILHHPWVDLFPFPCLRDNVLIGMAAGVLDDDELCADILEVKDEDLSGKLSLIVWGQPWDFTAWEANEAFFKKWGFLARGCSELLESTNSWRAKRGEKSIVFEV